MPKNFDAETTPAGGLITAPQPNVIQTIQFHYTLIFVAHRYT
jgi:hypothetical protein